MSPPPVPPIAETSLLDRLSAVGRRTVSMSRATRIDEICREALAAIAEVAGTPRAAVLLFDRDGVMRFEAWNGLSDRYRTAVEGHTPWTPGQPDPAPILLSEPARDPTLAPFAEVIVAEGIRSMAMVPLVTGGGTIGKFMVYHDRPDAFGTAEVQLVLNVAAHTAFAIDRQRAVDALRRSEERYRSVVDHLKEVVFRTDPAGVLTFLNRSWLEVSGFELADALGRPLLAFVHPEDAVPDLFAEVVCGHRDHCRHELRLRHRAGGFRWVEIFARLSRRPDGSLSGVAGTINDIDERRATAEALRTAEARLRESQRLESLGVLAGGIAHDFNNLLMGVLGNAGIALSELPAGSPAETAVQDVVLAARRAADLTRQLLAYSGRGKFLVQRLDLATVVRESAQLLATAISRKASVVYDLAADLPEVEGDGTQLRQVAMNLLSNASEALEDRPGTIAVRIVVVEADRELLDRGLHGSELAPGRYVQLEVEDSGCGMDAQTLHRMFDPFFTTKLHGRGLGLAAVVGIVRGHHGTLTVDSAVGRGTTVRVLLPIAAPVATEPSPQPDARRIGVLVVDDEAMVRKVTARMLERSGFRVELAENGRRAVEVLSDGRPGVDLVLLDLTMPELSGEETLALIRQRWPHLPVVLTSGYTADVTHATGPGKTLFLQKPYLPAELQAVVRSALEAG